MYCCRLRIGPLALLEDCYGGNNCFAVRQPIYGTLRRCRGGTDSFSSCPGDASYNPGYWGIYGLCEDCESEGGFSFATSYNTYFNWREGGGESLDTRPGIQQGGRLLRCRDVNLSGPLWLQGGTVEDCEFVVTGQLSSGTEVNPNYAADAQPAVRVGQKGGTIIDSRLDNGGDGTLSMTNILREFLSWETASSYVSGTDSLTPTLQSPLPSGISASLEIDFYMTLGGVSTHIVVLDDGAGNLTCETDGVIATSPPSTIDYQSGAIALYLTGSTTSYPIITYGVITSVGVKGMRSNVPLDQNPFLLTYDLTTIAPPASQRQRWYLSSTYHHANDANSGHTPDQARQSLESLFDDSDGLVDLRSGDEIWIIGGSTIFDIVDLSSFMGVTLHVEVGSTLITGTPEGQLR